MFIRIFKVFIVRFFIIFDVLVIEVVIICHPLLALIDRLHILDSWFPINKFHFFFLFLWMIFLIRIILEYKVVMLTSTYTYLGIFKEVLLSFSLLLMLIRLSLWSKRSICSWNHIYLRRLVHSEIRSSYWILLRVLRTKLTTFRIGSHMLRRLFQILLLLLSILIQLALHSWFIHLMTLFIWSVEISRRSLEFKIRLWSLSTHVQRLVMHCAIIDASILEIILIKWSFLFVIRYGFILFLISHLLLNGWHLLILVLLTLIDLVLLILWLLVIAKILNALT